MNENEYATKSIGEAAYLYANGAVLLCAIDSRGFEHFTFENKDDCTRRLAEQFYEDAAAPARTLFLAQGTLRQEASKARAQVRQR
jgi:hypothetical protein